MLRHFLLSQDLVLSHLALYQDLPLKFWDTSYCRKTPHSSVGTLRTVPRPYTQVLIHFTLSQDHPLKRWDTSHCPKTLCPSVATLHTVPRPSVVTPRTVPRPPTQVLGHLVLSQDPPLKCWKHFALSQDLPLKCWDTSHRPKIACSSVGTLRTVPRLPARMLEDLALSQDLVLGHFVLSQDLSLKCWDTSHCPTTFHSSFGTLHIVPRPSVGTLRTVPRPYTQVLGHLALSQDHPLQRWDTSHCPKTLRPSVWTLHTVPRPSFGTPRTVPRPYTQVLGHFTLSQDPSLQRWDTSHCPKTACLIV